jgi:hypothetical protein
MEQDCPLIFYNIWAFLSRQDLESGGNLVELHSITTGHCDHGPI